MKYYVGGNGWETKSPGIGRRFYPNGTLIDDSLAQFAHLAAQGPPIDAIAADQSTYNAMIAVYPPFRVQYFAAAGIVPAASTRMPALVERYNDGSPVVKRPGSDAKP
jgi:hypothetical protein